MIKKEKRREPKIPQENYMVYQPNRSKRKVSGLIPRREGEGNE